MTVKLLTEHHLKFLSLKGDYKGSSESTLVKIPHCGKSHVAPEAIQAASTFLRARSFRFFFFVAFIRNDITIVQNKSYKCRVNCINLFAQNVFLFELPLKNRSEILWHRFFAVPACFIRRFRSYIAVRKSLV